MEIQIREISNISIVDIKGKLAAQDANEQLRDTVDSLLAKNKKQILLNLSQMEYIDSSGVGELVQSLKTVENLGGRLKIVNPDNRTYKTLSIALLLPAFDVSQNEEEAITKFIS
jgi:anti-sigma B factor antagonist